SAATCSAVEMLPAHGKRITPPGRNLRTTSAGVATPYRAVFSWWAAPARGPYTTIMKSWPTLSSRLIRASSPAASPPGEGEGLGDGLCPAPGPGVASDGGADAGGGCGAGAPVEQPATMSSDKAISGVRPRPRPGLRPPPTPRRGP